MSARKQMEPVRIIRMPAVRDKVHLNKTAIYELIKRGEFPRPVKLTERSVAWVEAEVDAWIAARIATRDDRLKKRA